MQHIRRADTNIIGIQFSILKKSGSLHTGDAIICSNRDCTAALSHLSQLNPVAGRDEKVPQSWECGFCKLKWAIDHMSFVSCWRVSVYSLLHFWWCSFSWPCFRHFIKKRNRTHRQHYTLLLWCKHLVSFCFANVGCIYTYIAYAYGTRL